MGKGDIKVSVIVPVYNVEHYVVRCLDSIKNQTLIDYEVIIVDDGSTDNSGNICDKYCEDDRRFRVIHQKNKGLSGARNTGLTAAIGQYIIFIDSDDYIDLKTLETLSNRMDKEQLDCLSYGAIEVEENERRNLNQHINKNDFGRKYTGLDFMKKYIPLSTVPLYMFDKKFLVENNLKFAEGILHEDMKFTPEMMLECRAFIPYEDSLYFYIKRQGSIMTSWTSAKNYQDMCWITETFFCQFKASQSKKKNALKKIIPSYMLVCEEIFNQLSPMDMNFVVNERKQLYHLARRQGFSLGFKGWLISIIPKTIHKLRNAKRVFTK